MIAEVARRQHGIVSLAQLHAAGLSEKAIRHRVRHGHMTRMHRGVYRIGPLTSVLAEPFAAVLASGPTAVLSHHAAAALHGIAKPRPGPVDVTVTAGHRRPSGVSLHRSPLAPEERTQCDGIPLTTAARTLVDVAPAWSRRELERGVEQAVILGLTTEAELYATAEGRKRGAARLRCVLTDFATPSLTRSEAERRLIELIRKAQLPHPIANAGIGRYEVDLLWPGQQLVVEVDGFAFHSSRQAFERDRARDAALQVAGYRVIRFTWRQIVREPYAVAATLAAVLHPR